MLKKTKKSSHKLLRKALYLVAIAVVFSIPLFTLSKSAKAAEPNFTFDVRRDGQSQREINDGATVNVAINANVSKNLKNIKVFVNGAEKTGFDKTTSGTGKHVIGTIKLNGAGQTFKFKVKATNEGGNQFDMKSVDGGDAIDVRVKTTNSSSGSGGGGGSGGNGSGSSGSSSSSTESAAEVTTKPKLTVEPGPLEGLAGSKTGTVNGDKVTGGIVFKVKFKRPKAEVYDLKTMHVDITKDGQPRITIYKNVDSNIDVKEDGDFKIYTFKRYYNTVNKPNGTSTWVANFQPNVPTPVADTQSDPLSLNIDNANSTAEQTCRDLKTEVNNLFDTMTARIDKNQAEIDAVNTRIDAKYTELNLASTNPIPEYDAKKARNAQLSADVNTKQTELEALKLTCANGRSVEDAGAQVAAFKVKLEEAKGAMSAYRAATLDLLGELRTRLPDNSGGDDDVTIPAGFVKYNTSCYSFAARRGFTASDAAIQLKGPCNKQVSFEKEQSDGLVIAGRISPLPWPVTNGTLAQNVQSVKNTEVANGNEIVDERSFQLDGHNAVRFIARNNNSSGTEDSLHVLVEAPYKIDGVDVSGYDIYVSSYSHTGSPINVQLGNFVKDATDKALSTWRWKDGDDGGGNGGGDDPGVPAANRINTKCYSFSTEKTHKLVNVTSDEQGRRFNCEQSQEFKNSSNNKVILNIGSGIDQNSNATAESNVRMFRSRLGLDNNPNFQLTEENLTVDGDPAIKLSLVNRERNLKAVYTFLESPRFIIKSPTDGSRYVGIQGALLYYEAGAPNSAKDRLAGNVLDEALETWQWKDPPAEPIAFDPDGEVPQDELSKVACIGNGSDGPRVEVIYLKNEGQSNSDLDSPFAGLTQRQFIKRGAARMNREVMQSAQKQDGFRQVRFITNSDCEVKVRQVNLAAADQSPDFFRVYSKLSSSRYNLNDPNKKYLVFWSDENLSDQICGVGGVAFQPGQAPPDEEFIARSKDPNPRTNLFNNNSGLAVFRRPCWFPNKAPGQVVPGDVQLHELMHAFGAVIAGSPNSTNKIGGIGHCTDLNDVMCYQDGRPNVRMKPGVCPGSYDGFLLDCKGEDYFGISPRAGSFLDNNWNSANSKWFTSNRGSNQ